jgi:DNA (cytosine-5)-methyltransferase 1
VAYADESRPQGRGERRNGADQWTAGAGGLAGSVADTSGVRRSQGIYSDKTGTHRGSGSSDSSWSDCEWIPCSDGVSRPTQPGVHPLSHGLSGRVGGLRGFGNAIVPQLAAAFIRAALEARC